MDTNKILREKARWMLSKNSTCYFEQILEATPHKTTAVRPLTPISKTIPERWTWHEHYWRNKNEHIRVLTDQQEIIYIRAVQTLYVDWRTCWERKIIGKRKRQGNYWSECDLMIMMMMMKMILKFSWNLFLVFCSKRTFCRPNILKLR